MMTKFFISVIMPVLNEKESVIASINNTLVAFDDLGIKGEVIVVNDGSTDNTPKLIEQKIGENDRIRMISHKKPEGIGSSFWDGVDNARFDIVTILPGDNENDPWETLRYINLLEHVDIVVPFAYNKNIRSLLRNVLSFLYLFIVNTTFMTDFKYTNSTVIYRKSILKQLKHRSYSFFYQADILIRTAKEGYLSIEVPYRLGLREAGKSKLVSFSSLWKGAKEYLRLVKDIYLSRVKKLNKEDFCPDSSTAKRYNLTTKYKGIYGQVDS